MLIKYFFLNSIITAVIQGIKLPLGSISNTATGLCTDINYAKRNIKLPSMNLQESPDGNKQ